MFVNNYFYLFTRFALPDALSRTALDDARLAFFEWLPPNVRQELRCHWKSRWLSDDFLCSASKPHALRNSRRLDLQFSLVEQINSSFCTCSMKMVLKRKNKKKNEYLQIPSSSSAGRMSIRLSWAAWLLLPPDERSWLSRSSLPCWAAHIAAQKRGIFLILTSEIII